MKEGKFVTNPDGSVTFEIDDEPYASAKQKKIQKGKEEQSKTVTLDLEDGNQTVLPDEGKVLNEVEITKPNTLLPGNIKKDIDIAGVIGTLEEGIVPTGNINLTDTNQTNVTNYATAQVVDSNLVESNIKKDVTILGITGTYEPSGSGVWTEVNVGNGNYTVWVIFDGQNNLMHATATITFETDNKTYTSDTNDIEYYCFKGVSGGQYIKTKVSANDIGSNYYNRVLITPNVVGSDVCLKSQQNSNIDTDTSFYIPAFSNQDLIAMVYFKWYEN